MFAQLEPHYIISKYTESSGTGHLEVGDKIYKYVKLELTL